MPQVLLFLTIIFLLNLIIVRSLSVQRNVEMEMELKLVHLIWRHGERNIERSYPNDPYKDMEKYWPEGFGQLTEKGIHQHRELGRFFRKRYIESGFLKDIFDPKEVVVLSSNFNRTVMSAEANLGEFFGVQDATAKYPNTTIPLNVIEKWNDHKLHQIGVPCPKLQKAFKDFFRSSEIARQIHKEYQWVFNHATRYSGQVVDDFEKLGFLYDILYVEDARNYKLPEWTKRVYPSPMNKLYAYLFKFLTYTDELKRFRGGPLLKDIIRHMDLHVGGHQGAKNKKLFAYSAHDTTISTVMGALGVFDSNSLPNYASALMIELKKNLTSGDYVVQVLYKKDVQGDPIVLRPPGCPTSSCELSLFSRLYRKLLPLNWHQECQLL